MEKKKKKRSVNLWIWKEVKIKIIKIIKIIKKWNQEKPRDIFKREKKNE